MKGILTKRPITMLGLALILFGLVGPFVLGVSPPAGWPGHSVALVQVKDSNGFWIQGNVNWEWWRGSTLKKSGTQATHSDDYMSCYVIVPDYGYQGGDVYKFWATSGDRQSAVVSKTATADVVSTWKSYPAIWPLFDFSLVVPAAPAPSGKATISVTTIGYPSGDVIVNGVLWGVAPQRRDVDPGTYAVSFGYNAAYTIPQPRLQTRTLTAGQVWEVVGDYGVYTRPHVPCYITTSVNPMGSGWITRSPDAYGYEYGTSVNLMATANEGYEFVFWSGDVTGISPFQVITLFSNMTVVANFRQLGTTPTPPITHELLTYCLYIGIALVVVGLITKK